MGWQGRVDFAANSAPRKILRVAAATRGMSTSSPSDERVGERHRVPALVGRDDAACVDGGESMLLMERAPIASLSTNDRRSAD